MQYIQENRIKRWSDFDLITLLVASTIEINRYMLHSHCRYSFVQVSGSLASSLASNPRNRSSESALEANLSLESHASAVD